jgi:RNA polymerase sigma-70 factor, ECF subfamily
MSSRATETLFRSLFEAHLGYVVATLRRLGVSEADTKDAAQETFLAIHGALDRYDPSRPPRPWIFAFCCRVAANHRRKSRDRGATEHEIALVADPSSGPEDRMREEQMLTILARALDGLAFEERAAFVLYDIDGARGEEVAQTLNLPLSTAYKRIKSAREHVQHQLALHRGGELA